MPLHSTLRAQRASLLLACFACSLLSCARQADPPNIIFLVVDALRADRLGVYGQEKPLTPNIDLFSESALVFSNAIAASSMTMGTAPALLAGLYPSEHGYTTYKTRISDDVDTLAEKLRSVGYKTLGVSTNPHVSEKNGLAQGFNQFIADRSWKDTNAKSVNEDFLEWLDGQGAEPYFAMLWYIDPHAPYVPPASFVPAHVPSNLRHLIGTATKYNYKLITTDDQRRVMEGLYNAEVQYFDEQLGTLLDELKKRGAFDSSVIVLTSDHGEELGDSFQNGKRIFGHGKSLTNAVLNVPLVIKLPHSRRTGSIDEVARSIDIMPTLLSLADPAGTYEGLDLLTLESAPLDRQYTVAELVTDEYGPYEMYSVQDSEYRMVETHIVKKQRLDVPHRSFYDLSSSDLVQDTVNPPERVRSSLESALAEYRLGLHPIPAQRIKHNKHEERLLLQQLRALGYVE